MASKKKPMEQKHDVMPALPPEQPINPTVQYMQNNLGAEFQIAPNYGLRGLPDVPKNRGNADLFHALANLPVEQGGLVGSNLEARPELFLGKDKPGKMLFSTPNGLSQAGAEMDGASGLTYIENPPRVYVDPTKAMNYVKGEAAVSPFSTAVHEMHHVTNINERAKPKPKHYKNWLSISPNGTAMENHDAQNKDDRVQFSQDAFDQMWPSTTDPRKSFANNNYEEAMASAAGLEAITERGTLPWNTKSGKQLFNTPERQGAYVDATRTGREPIAFNPDLYKYRNGLNRFTPDFDEAVQKAHNSRGAGGWNALMNTRPINQVVADWFK